MKKSQLFIPIACCAVFGLYRFSQLSVSEILHADGSSRTVSEAAAERTASDHANASSVAASKPSLSLNSKDADSAASRNKLPQNSTEIQTQTGPDPAITQTAAPKLDPTTAASLPPKSTVGETAPSIGTVRVLGHRGCPSNTQGWFLSVGNPEQYEFSVSDDGETVVVEPLAPNLTGNFEFIHCADPGQFTGQRVRFSATIKAQGVAQTAQLHLRGENAHQDQNLSAITQVVGTYDWKDFAVEAEVGPEVALFSYGLTFKSTGKLWLSHPKFVALQ